MAIKSQADVAQALVVAAEVLGHEMSPVAARVMAQELSRFEPEEISRALRRCIRECRGRLTLVDVTERLPGQHIGGNEAWALCPHDESETVVWSDEIAAAFGAVRPMLARGDAIGARMSFLEAYKRRVAEAQTVGRRPNWTPSFGHDLTKRALPLLAAAEMGRLSSDYVARVLPRVTPVAVLTSGEVSLTDLLAKVVADATGESE